MLDSTFPFLGFSLFVPAEAKQVLLAALLGLLIGLERAWRHKVASLRTFSMISAGSCLFTILSVSAMPGTGTHFDVTRIAAQVVAGVGFLGGGVIFKTASRIEGITTAAMIWLTAAIGMACGFDQGRLAVWAFIIWYGLNVFSISLHRFIDFLQGRKRHARRAHDSSPTEAM